MDFASLNPSHDPSVFTVPPGRKPGAALEPLLHAQAQQLLVRVHLLFALDCVFGSGPAAASRASRSAFSRSRF